MNIKSFDRQNLPLLRTAMQDALNGLESKFGIKIVVGNASFSPDNAKFKVELATVSADGVVQTRERSSFETLADLYDLDAKMLDQEITYGGNRYIITGLAPRRSKYPVLAKRVDTGKGYCLPVDGVKLAWARKQPVTINPPTPTTVNA